MSTSVHVFGTVRSLAIRTRPSIYSAQRAQFLSASRRAYADESPKGPNKDVLGHVSEEAAELGEITGETKPDLGQGIPAQEIFRRDEKAREQAPQVVKEELDNKASNNSPSQSSKENRLASQQHEHGGDLEEFTRPGHKFGIPELPLPPDANLKYRYDPLVHQFTRLIMRDGKLSRAQRNMAYILNHLRISPAPKVDPQRPLLPGAPPPSHFMLDPIQYLGIAIDSVAPLVKMKSLKGMAGGGKALMLPVPMELRRRRRTAVQWILDAAVKKSDKGSGKYQFAHKVADEVIRVVEGKSTAWEKRLAIHKLATTNRANLVLMAKMKKR